MIDKGVNVSFGSDWPVAPVNPMYGVFSAVTRITGDGKNPGGWYPAEKIAVEDAIRAYTAGNAYGSFLEGKIGILKKGAYADFTVLEEDILTIDPVKIKELKVIRTVVNGKEVFLRGK
jgi:predicted amidohydrolase YtcJ